MVVGPCRSPPRTRNGKGGGCREAEILYIFHKIFFFPTFQCLKFVQTIPPVRSSQPYPSSSFLLPPRANVAPPAARGYLLLRAWVLRPAPHATCCLRCLLLRACCASCCCVPLPAAVVYWGARPLLRRACPPVRERHRHRRSRRGRGRPVIFFSKNVDAS